MGAANFSNNVAASGTLTAKGNVSGAADLTVNRISGSARGMTTLGSAIFSHATSIKASGSIAAATTVSGTQALQSAKLTINGSDVITQAKALGNVTTISGASSLAGAKLTINGSDVITQAKALGNVTTISGAGALSAASLTINGTERVSQNGNATFVALTADTFDVREINNTSVTTTTLEIVDKLIIIASGANASNTNQAGIQFGGTSGSSAISSILWENGNSRLSSSTALHVGGAFTGHTTISGASSLAGAKLTINGSDIVTQAKALGNVTTISGASSLAGAKLTINGSDIVTQAKALGNVTTITAAGNISGAADLIANRITGSERGAVIAGTALFTNSTSIKASGSISAATTVSGTQALQSAKLTINGVDVATQAGALVAPTTVSGAGGLSAASLTINSKEVVTQGNIAGVTIGNASTISSSAQLSSAKLTINGSDVITQAKALGNVTTISGASSLAGAKLTINGSDIVSQAKAIANVTTISGAADLTVNRISGSARGMTTLGTALFTNSTSIKTSGSIACWNNRFWNDWPIKCQVNH